MIEDGAENIITEKESFVLVKPGHDRIIGQILSVIKEKGLKIISVETKRISRPQAVKVYEQHEGKPFFEPLISLTMGDATLIRVHLDREDAIQAVRERVIPEIRNKFQVVDSRGVNKLQDCAHAPDSVVAYVREAKIFGLL